MIRFGVGSYNRADRKHLPDDTERNKQEICAILSLSQLIDLSSFP